MPRRLLRARALSFPARAWGGGNGSRWPCGLRPRRMPRRFLRSRALSFPARAWGLIPTLLTFRPWHRVSLEAVTDPAETFQAHRRRLLGLAYRLLGAASDAEDVVQDAYLRWSAADPDSAHDQ